MSSAPKRAQDSAHTARGIVKSQALIGVACVSVFVLVSLIAPELIETADVGSHVEANGFGTRAAYGTYVAYGAYASALSALLASLAVVLPNGYFAWVSETSYDANRLLAQGVMKMILTITLIALCIVVIGIEPVGFFTTLVAIQLAYWTPVKVSK